MCGFVRRVTDSPHVQALLDLIDLGNVALPGGDFRPRGILPGVIIEEEGAYKTIDAMWWFLLQSEGGQMKPNPKATTFNAHKLGLPLWKGPIKTHRALVLADAIGESNPVEGYKTKKQHYLMEGKQGVALGALYREWPTDDGSIYKVVIPVSTLSNFALIANANARHLCLTDFSYSAACWVALRSVPRSGVCVISLDLRSGIGNKNLMCLELVRNAIIAESSCHPYIN